MTWLQQWHALAARIDGLVRAGEYLIAALKIYAQDSFGVVGKSILPELNAINTEIERLGKVHANELPEQALRSLHTYIGQRWGKSSFGDAKSDIQTVAALAAFRSEFEFLIRDSEIEGRDLAELSFEHLRRSLVVDEHVRTKWQKAFEKRETECEKLGAIHLLGHGIWAFKIIASGGATDLVFAEPMDYHSQVLRRTARALILTEWKVVKTEDDVNAKAEEARNQTEIYRAGVLGDTELKRTRYIVLVCKSDFIPPEDIFVRAVTFRHIVLPINPERPSKIARRRARQANQKIK